MKHQIVLSLSFFTLLNHAFHANAVNIEIQNNCLQPVWPAILTRYGHPITLTGFKLDSLQLHSLKVPDNWTGQIYPRTFCSTTGKRFLHCEVGKPLSPPVLVVELDLAPENGRSNCSINPKDGFNVPVSVTPFDNSCKRIFCLKDLKLRCPDWLAVKDDEGATIACKSASLATNDDEYCCSCRGRYAGFGKCPANPNPYFVENKCPLTVSHAFSARKYTCFGGIGYRIDFC